MREGKLEKANMVLERFFVDTVMIKMRGVIEKKLGAAGGPAHNVDPYPEANRFLNLVHKPETLFGSIILSLHI
jgi:hypothetical protein